MEAERKPPSLSTVFEATGTELTQRTAVVFEIEMATCSQSEADISAVMIGSPSRLTTRFVLPPSSRQSTTRRESPAFMARIAASSEVGGSFSSPRIQNATVPPPSPKYMRVASSAYESVPAR